MEQAEIERDLQQIRRQEKALEFTEFGPDTAWAVGKALRRMAVECGAGMTFAIEVAARQLFVCTTSGGSAGQADWIRRKRNTVMRFGRSSYALGLELERDGKTMEARHGLELKDFAMHGGGFPIVLRGTGCVGTIIASGLPQREDHALVVQALAEVLGVQVRGLDDPPL